MNSEINLIGTWNYRSFLILPAEGKKKAINGDAVAIKQWAVGTLEILSSTEHEFSGELTMVPPIKISVKRQPAKDSSDRGLFDSRCAYLLDRAVYRDPQKIALPRWMILCLEFSK